MRNTALKPLNRINAKQRRKSHEHHWLYEHLIYSLGDNDGMAIHRQCRECSVHELCKIPNPKWTRNTRGFDLTDVT